MPPKKYTVDEMSDLLDEKLSTLKRNIIAEVKASILELVEQKFKEKDEKIEILESQVSMLQNHVTNLKHAYDKKIDDLEQYGRRLCLRIDNVPYKEKETADEVLKIVKGKFTEAEVDIPDTVLDRAHRIGQPYTLTNSGVKVQSIITRFTTFRHRTIFYRKRKSLKEGVTVKLDLTKSKYETLKEAREVIDKVKVVKFVYADINCRLKVRFKDNTEKFFETVNDLNEAIAEFQRLD